MTTENQTTISPILPKQFTENNTHTRIEAFSKSSTTLEENRGNVIKPMSLRPNRSVKKNISLKPLGLKLR
ncbi:MAG: hypothetical protein Q7U04_03815 [Bacteriovorax sp.]|nr:hypothetical protein [Bacteriovorax sp.]